MLLRACFTSSLAVITTMPSVIGTVHAVCNLGIFSMRTKHIRQAACSDNPG